MKTILSILLVFAMVLNLPAPVVNGDLRSMTGGGNVSVRVSIEPLTDPTVFDGYIGTGTTTNFVATNGVFSVTLLPGAYKLTTGRRSWTFPVHDTTNAWNLDDLARHGGMPFVLRPGFTAITSADTNANYLSAKIVPGNGLLFTTNNAGGNETLTLTVLSVGTNILGVLGFDTNQFTVSGTNVAIEAGALLTNAIVYGLTLNVPATNTLGTASRVAVLGASKQLTNAQASIAEVDNLVGFPGLLTVAMSNKVDESSGVLTNSSQYGLSAFLGPVAISNASPQFSIWKTDEALNQKGWTWTFDSGLWKFLPVADNGTVGTPFLQFERSGSSPETVEVTGNTEVTLTTPLVFMSAGARVVGNLQNDSLTASRAVVTDGSKVLISSATTLAELAFLSGTASNLQATINILNTALLNKVDENGGVITNGTAWGQFAAGTSLTNVTSNQLVRIDGTNQYLLVLDGAPTSGSFKAGVIAVNGLSTNKAPRVMMIMEEGNSSYFYAGGYSNSVRYPDMTNFAAGVKIGSQGSIRYTFVDNDLTPEVNEVGRIGIEGNKPASVNAKRLIVGSTADKIYIDAGDFPGTAIGDLTGQFWVDSGSADPNKLAWFKTRSGTDSGAFDSIPFYALVNNYKLGTNSWFHGQTTNSGGYWGTNTLSTNYFAGKTGIATDAPSKTFSVAEKLLADSDGQLFWGAAGTEGMLTWDTGKAVVRSQAGKNLDILGDIINLQPGSSFVGVGTNNPSEKLHTHGSIRIDNGKLKLGATITNSIPETDTAWVFSQTNGSGIAQIWFMSEDGTATLGSPHADDAPSGFYYITNYTRMVPEIKKSLNPFQVGGVVEWKNLSLQLYLMKLQLLGTNFASLPAGVRSKIADALHQEETFSEYNTRLGYTNGHPKKLVALNWQTIQDGKQLTYDLGRSNELYQISQGETNITARPVKDIRKAIPALINR